MAKLISKKKNKQKPTTEISQNKTTNKQTSNDNNKKTPNHQIIQTNKENPKPSHQKPKLRNAALPSKPITGHFVPAEL